MRTAAITLGTAVAGLSFTGLMLIIAAPMGAPYPGAFGIATIAGLAVMLLGAVCPE